jgi:hypothetical protein
VRAAPQQSFGIERIIGAQEDADDVAQPRQDQYGQRFRLSPARASPETGGISVT